MKAFLKMPSVTHEKIKMYQIHIFLCIVFLELHIVVVNRLIVVLEIVGIMNYNLHWLHGT